MNDIKIYFAGSIRGGREDTALYHQIIDELKQYGTVLTEHVGDDTIRKAGEQDASEKYIHDRDMEWLHVSDLVIAEVTIPSLGVGYEIATAIHLGKSVYCFFNGGRGQQLSAMIRGSKDITVIDYHNYDGIKNAIRLIFKNLQA
jgi:nucleoside 2-deoxyribosyltransferase